MDKKLFDIYCEEYLQAVKEGYAISFTACSHQPGHYELDPGTEHPLLVKLLFPEHYAPEDIQDGIDALTYSTTQ